jgi:SAM-dependent methyltransferase
MVAVGFGTEETLRMDMRRAAEYWDEQHDAGTFLRAEWSRHPLALARLQRILGAATREEWFARTYLAGRSARRGLGIGVGPARSELRLLASGAVERYDLYDVSPGSLASAREQAERLGLMDRVRIFCADIHTVSLPPETYDVVTFIASLHHIERLDDVLRACYAALAPGGILWAAEYIGPDRFAYPDADTAFAKRLYRVLDPGVKKAWEPELRFPTPEEVAAADPTESVHSSEIVSAMRRVFARTEVIPTYGTLSFILSWCLDPDAIHDTEKGRDAFQTILDIDTAMLDAGQLPHYFAYLIGHKPAAPPRRSFPFRRRA